MTSYGGYSRTSYNAQGAEDGGGFMGASQQGSQGGGGGGQSSYQNDSLRPVTIKQLLDAQRPYPDGELSIDGRPIAQVTLVGQVRQVSPQATNVTFRIDDGTGTIDVKKWVESEKMDEGDPAQEYPLDGYVRVWGRLKAFDNRRHVGALFIRRVEDFNEVNYHLLEAAYVHLVFTKGAPNGAGGGGGGEESMFVDGYGAGGGVVPGGGASSKAHGCSPAAQRIFAYLQNQPGGNDGIEANVLAKGIGMSVSAVEAAADELLSAGLIYPTLDDHTWAILDY